MKSVMKGEINLLVILKTTLFVFLLLFLIIINFFLVFPVILPVSLFIKRDKNILLTISRFGIRIGFKLLFILNLSKFKKEIQKIQKSQSSRIYVINHASMFDIILLFLLPDEVKILVKESYTRIPLLGYIIKKTGHIIVKNSEEGQIGSTFDEAISAINSGLVIAIFPEGTRSKNGAISRFKSGALHIAFETKAEIIPVVIDSWNIVRPGNGLWFRDSDLHASVLPAIQYETYQAYDPLEFSKILRKKMVYELKQLRDNRLVSEKKFYRQYEPFKSIDNASYQKYLENK